MSDMHRLQQILLNLLTNANKFCRGGNIRIFCKYKKEYSQIFFTVTDEGIGIKPEDKQRLFKPFTKLDDGKSLNPNGIGLGLSICKSILVKIGCDIVIVDSVEKNEHSKVHGTSIAFSLPVF